MIKKDGELHLSRHGHRLSPEQARPRVHDAREHLGRGPPRLHPAGAGRDPGLRPSKGFAPRAARPACGDPATRPARAHVEAGRELRDAPGRGAGRGQRCGAVYFSDAPFRQPSGLRPRHRQGAVPGEPGVLRAVRARAAREPVPRGRDQGHRRSRRAMLSIFRSSTSKKSRTSSRRWRSIPRSVEEAALAYEPHRLTFYLQDLAGLLHNYYFKHRVITEDASADRLPSSFS